MPYRSPYVIRPQPRPEAACRLFLFHHAGGSFSVFRDWVPSMPRDVELCLLSYPGRLGLHRIPMPDSLEDLAELLQGAIEPLLDRPYALFGHSMGGLMAYQLARNLCGSGAALPFWVGVSGFEAPSRVRRKTRERSLHLYDDEALRRELLALGGTPDDILRDDQFWQPFMNLIRGDLRLFERWRPDPRAPTLPVPLSSFVGDADRLVGVQGCAYWEYFTTDWRGLDVLPGGHFYFLSDPGALVGRILDQIERTRPGAS